MLVCLGVGCSSCVYIYVEGSSVRGDGPGRPSCYVWCVRGPVVCIV